MTFFIVVFGVAFIGWLIWGFFLFKDDVVKAYKKHKSKKTPKTVEVSTAKKKSQAFVKGYSDMGIHAAGVPKSRKVKVRDDRFTYSDHYIDKYVNSLSVDKNNVPSFDDYSMRRVAREILQAGRVINPTKGQVDYDYLGGSADEFNDYYLGGMAFLADIDAVKGVLKDEDIAKKNKDALVEARKKGLKEINQKVVMDMKALDDIRSNAFNQPINAHEQWAEQMKEIQ